MKKSNLARTLFVIFVLFVGACKPSKTPIGQSEKSSNINTSRTPLITPVSPTNGTAILVYQQETRQEPNFSQVAYLEIPMQILINYDKPNTDNHMMEGEKEGEVHIALGAKGAEYCHMFFTLAVKITARGFFIPEKCAFNIGVSGIVGKVTERTGTCSQNPEKLFPDAGVQSVYIPPPTKSVELNGATLSVVTTVAKDTTMTLTLKDVYLPNIEACQW